MEFGSDTRWMQPVANPAAFELSASDLAERDAALRAARRLDAMIRLLCPEPTNEPGVGRLAAA